MKYILILSIICLIAYLIYHLRKKESKLNISINNKKETGITLIKNDIKPLDIKVAALSAEKIDTNLLAEITDNKLLAHVNNLVPELAQIGNTANNAVKAASNTLYQAIIPAGTKLTESNNMQNAFRGIYHGSKGIKGHADLVQVNQTNTAITNTVSTGIGVTSMIVGQYYMAQINSEIAKINEELSKISNFQDNEYKGKILAIIIQIKRISTFQSEILENKQLRDLDIDKLNVLEQSCTELLGQANCAIKDFTTKNDLDYKEYCEELSNIHTWYGYQKTLLELLYKITELKNVLYLGTMSKEQAQLVLEAYTKQVAEVNSLLYAWHEENAIRLGIDVETSRRKRKGFDGAIHWLPGLFNDELNFSTISENTKIMIEEQTKNNKFTPEYKSTDLFNKDVKLISKDGKIYYLPQ